MKEPREIKKDNLEIEARNIENMGKSKVDLPLNNSKR